MKKILVIITVTITVMASNLFAQAPAAGFDVLIGYRNVYYEGTKFAHSTHPGDLFLSGPAGTTSIDSGLLHFAEFGVGYHFPLTEKIDIGLNVGGLFGGTRNEQKNANDPRPDGHAAFIYSKARWGVFGDLDLAYHMKHLFIGAEASVSGIFVSSGWDRYNSDESETSDFATQATVGPLIGYKIDENSVIKASVQMGQGGASGNIGFQYNF